MSTDITKAELDKILKEDQEKHRKIVILYDQSIQKFALTITGKKTIEDLLPSEVILAKIDWILNRMARLEVSIGNLCHVVAALGGESFKVNVVGEPSSPSPIPN